MTSVSIIAGNIYKMIYRNNILELAVLQNVMYGFGYIERCYVYKLANVFGILIKTNK